MARASSRKAVRKPVRRKPAARKPAAKAASRSRGAARTVAQARKPGKARKPAKAGKKAAPAGSAYDAIEKQVITALATVPPMALDGLWPNRRWTHEIKAHLAAMGLESGHAVFADEALGAGAQWLFALCWVDLRNGRMRALPLALEVEWNLNMGEIAEDFDKLVQSTATHRVMVFEQRNAADVGMALKNLKARVAAYGPRRKGDRYLFAGYDFTGRQFVFNLLVVP